MDVPKWSNYNTDFEDSLRLAAPKVCREVSLKVLVLGDMMVGKTSLVQRYVKNAFKHHYKGTIGVDFTIKSIQWSEELTIKVQFWDIAGMQADTSDPLISCA
ncbi:hypothetical protein C0Q70_15426 [Pomacea canaliculata]|uniref:Ras-related protein Rab n=1 Tax=Pomacea canaliculata TaxID=400727 RepID=A0A2T7NUV1_POMCA|nr:hypothetical protein C0Q70_15426 [Pomacea canaliculata]